MRRLRCPRCHTSRRLEPVWEHGVEIDVCLRCGGLWFDAGELEHAVRDYRGAEVEPRGVDWTSRSGPAEESCPCCAIDLAEHPLKEHSSQRVQACSQCRGVWLRRGALAYAQAGHQLVEARARTGQTVRWTHWCFQFFSGLPVEFNFKPRKRPVVTYALIAINVLVFLLQLAIGNEPSFRSNYALYPQRAGEAQWYLAMVTHNFLHGGVIHLAGNMYFLWILGDNLEDLLGRRKFLAFYAVAALASGIAITLTPFSPQLPRIGASGAVSGVIAAYAVLFRHARLTFMLIVFQLRLPARAYVSIWVVFNVIGLVLGVPGIAFGAHLGGAACGLVIALVAYRRLLRRDPLLRLLNGVRLHQLVG